MGGLRSSYPVTNPETGHPLPLPQGRDMLNCTCEAEQSGTMQTGPLYVGLTLGRCGRRDGGADTIRMGRTTLIGCRLLRCPFPVGIALTGKYPTGGLVTTLLWRLVT